MPLRHDAPRTAASPWVLLGFLGLVALRLPHLAGPLDDPHSWRQCDTVFYTWDFWRHGIDLLHPRVSWLGGHRTLLFEFPLPEAIAASLDRAFGYTPLWDRIVTLAFTLLSAAYLRGFVRRIADAFTADAATAVYLVAPLAQFFSRAPQPDFAAQAFAHGLLYHALRASRREGGAHLAAAAACAALAAMIKAPYLVPVLGPLAAVALAAGAAGIASTALALAAGATAFVLWRRHVDAVNGAAPDWSFLPGYYKELNPLWWYIGDLHQRFVPGDWIKLAKRLVFEIATPAGVVLAACGAAFAPAAGTRRPDPRPLALAWLATTFVYLLVFFPLNVIHDYYQVPFLAPVALLVALGLRALTRDGAPPSLRAAGWAAGAALVALALVLPGRLGYYHVDEVREAAARVVAARVPEDDLVVVVDHNSQYSDPRLLARAHRCGWAVDAGDLGPDRLARLEALGARWVAWVSERGVARLAPPAFLAAREAACDTLLPARPARDGRARPPLGELHLYRLARGEAGRGGNPR